MSEITNISKKENRFVEYSGLFRKFGRVFRLFSNEIDGLKFSDYLKTLPEVNKFVPSVNDLNKVEDYKFRRKFGGTPYEEFVYGQTNRSGMFLVEVYAIVTARLRDIGKKVVFSKIYDNYQEAAHNVKLYSVDFDLRTQNEDFKIGYSLSSLILDKSV